MKTSWRSVDSSTRYSLSLSEVSEGAVSLASSCRPVSSLFSITGLFSTSVRRSSRVSSCDITAFTDSPHTIMSLTAPTKVRWRRGEHGIQLIIIENRFCGAMGPHLPLNGTFVSTIVTVGRGQGRGANWARLCLSWLLFHIANIHI